MEEVVNVNLAGIHVAIATPAYGSQFTGAYVRSLSQTIPNLMHYSVAYNIITTEDALVTKARNAIIKAFLPMTECTHLLFIDADMEWEPKAVMRLLASGKDFVGIAGPRKVDSPSYCVNVETPFYTKDRFDMIQVNEVGTGMLLLSREAICKLVGAFPEKFFDIYEGSHTYNLFETCVDDFGNFWSEDYLLCRKWRALNGEIWCDTMSTLHHVGQKKWRGNFGEYLWGGELSVDINNV